MIKKLLICGKQVYMATQKPDPHIESGMAIDLEMPIESYWEAQELLKTVTYMLASGETQAEVSALIRKLFSVCAPYATSEKNRTWLIERASET